MKTTKHFAMARAGLRNGKPKIMGDAFAAGTNHDVYAICDGHSDKYDYLGSSYVANYVVTQMESFLDTYKFTSSEELKSRMQEVTIQANESIRTEHKKETATTLDLIVIQDGMAYLQSVGDGEVYSYHRGNLQVWKGEDIGKGREYYRFTAPDSGSDMFIGHRFNPAKLESVRVKRLQEDELLIPVTDGVYRRILKSKIREILDSLSMEWDNFSPELEKEVLYSEEFFHQAVTGWAPTFNEYGDLAQEYDTMRRKLGEPRALETMLTRNEQVKAIAEKELLHTTRDDATALLIVNRKHNPYLHKTQVGKLLSNIFTGKPTLETKDALSPLFDREENQRLEKESRTYFSRQEGFVIMEREVKKLAEDTSEPTVPYFTNNDVKRLAIRVKEFFAQSKYQETNLQARQTETTAKDARISALEGELINKNKEYEALERSNKAEITRLNKEKTDLGNLVQANKKNEGMDEPIPPTNIRHNNCITKELLEDYLTSKDADAKYLTKDKKIELSKGDPVLQELKDGLTELKKPVEGYKRTKILTYVSLAAATIALATSILVPVLKPAPGRGDVERWVYEGQHIAVETMNLESYIDQRLGEASPPDSNTQSKDTTELPKKSTNPEISKNIQDYTGMSPKQLMTLHCPNSPNPSMSKYLLTQWGQNSKKIIRSKKPTLTQVTTARTTYEACDILEYPLTKEDISPEKYRRCMVWNTVQPRTISEMKNNLEKFECAK